MFPPMNPPNVCLVLRLAMEDIAVSIAFDELDVYMQLLPRAVSQTDG
jgi:hypothetical protein